jgi:hypothetical protein
MDKMTTQTETLKGFNNKLLDNASTIKATRLDTEVTTKDVIRYILNGINDESVIGSTKKDKINFILKMELEGLKAKQFHDKFKLAIKVARLKLIDGLKIRDELLTIGQVNNLISNFEINTINSLFDKYNIEDYNQGITDFLKNSKVTCSSKKIQGDKVKKAKK